MTPWWQMSAALQKHWSVCQSFDLNEEGTQTGEDVSEWDSVFYSFIFPKESDGQMRFGCAVSWEKKFTLNSLSFCSFCPHFIHFCTFVRLARASIKNLVESNEFKVGTCLKEVIETACVCMCVFLAPCVIMLLHTQDFERNCMCLCACTLRLWGMLWQLWI